MNFLIGTATSADLQNVKAALSKLQEVQRGMVHVLDQSITLINKTNIAVNLNRRALFRLNNATKRIDCLVRNVQHDLLKLEPAIVFNGLQSQLHHLFHLVNAALRSSRWDLLNLRQEIKEANHGALHLTLVPPSLLKEVLHKVAHSLLPSYVLPESIKDNLHWYYRHLKTMLLPSTNSFHIITVVPVIYQTARFTIVQAHSLPVYNKHTDLLAQYKLKDLYLAVSQDRQRYALLSPAAVNDCLYNDKSFCPLRVPIQNYAKVPNCLAAFDFG